MPPSLESCDHSCGKQQYQEESLQQITEVATANACRAPLEINSKSDRPKIPCRKHRRTLPIEHCCFSLLEPINSPVSVFGAVFFSTLPRWSRPLLWIFWQRKK